VACRCGVGQVRSHGVSDILQEQGFTWVAEWVTTSAMQVDSDLDL